MVPGRTPSFRFRTEASGWARSLLRAVFGASRQEQISLAWALGLLLVGGLLRAAASL